MNTVILMGRLVRDPKVDTSNSGLCYAQFTVAVDRPRKKDAEKKADFPRCVAFGRTAEVIGDYIHKGDPILIEGRLQTDSYEDNNGDKRTSVDVIVNRFEFVSGRKPDGNSSGGPSKQQQYGSSNASNDFDSMGTPAYDQEEIIF